MAYIDSRDLLGELRDLLEDSSYDYNDEPVYPADMDAEDRERVNTLRDVLQELPGETVDGRDSYGCSMIPEDEFEAYAQELAEEIGAIAANASWPLSHVDWKAAAEALAQDYSRVEFDGTTYLCRD